MIKLTTDELVEDCDHELIEEFAVSLVDKDKDGMNEVLYRLEERMSGECICLEEECICGAW
jgi:hypothetical protein